MTLPGQLEQYGDDAVLAALECFEQETLHEFSGRDAEIVDELMRCGLVRASVQARYLLADGETRLRVQSNGLSVAGAWMKRVLDGGAGR